VAGSGCPHHAPSDDDVFEVRRHDRLSPALLPKIWDALIAVCAPV
jgi:hypothetical protein